MIRSVCAVVVSFIVWFLVATAGNWLLRVAVPGYTDVEVGMSFTLTMLICRLVLGLVSSLCAGFVCAIISAPRSYAVKVFAALMVVLFIPIHYNLWPKFPIWYQIFFLVTLAPAILLGALLRSPSLANRTT
jgi:hypothetical protein